MIRATIVERPVRATVNGEHIRATVQERRVVAKIHGYVVVNGVIVTGFNAENKSGVTLPAGCVVAKHSSGLGVVKAQADTSMLPAVGFTTSVRATTEVGMIQTEGLIDLSDWTAIVGTPTLAANATYYLSETPGQLTTTIPTGAGVIVQTIGRAMTPTTLDISITNPIRRN